MEALWLWISENILMIIIAAIEGVGLYVWKEKNPEKWIKWKKRKLRHLEKRRAINLRQVEKDTEEIEKLKKELEK